MMWFQRHEEPKAITDEYEQVSICDQRSFNPKRKTSLVSVPFCRPTDRITNHQKGMVGRREWQNHNSKGNYNKKLASIQNKPEYLALSVENCERLVIFRSLHRGFLEREKERHRAGKN